MTRRNWIRVAAAVPVCAAFAQKYDGPRPDKPDWPYLSLAGRLIATDKGEAKGEEKKDDLLYTIPGASATARTPLAEPVFLMIGRDLQPDKMGLFRFEVKNGNREVLLSRKGKGARPMRITVTRLYERLYKIEAAESLERGQYALSPEGVNTVFCFEVY
jgi:hypothetical protein